ncbi:uncharacterized protein LOC112499954 [Cynara cardunculus var. scolymus]|uniref:uncharacterized protein LOC112499954 n=1 Tax=Cynara cardunculus var. scolymus TaxID=59895 RepID=UPI000D62CA34|nr:uncharacterized protein LOC112499954 [Cynara cardunculus var. scolymus]
MNTLPHPLPSSRAHRLPKSSPCRLSPSPSSPAPVSSVALSTAPSSPQVVASSVPVLHLRRRSRFCQVCLAVLPVLSSVVSRFKSPVAGLQIPPPTPRRRSSNRSPNPTIVGLLLLAGLTSPSSSRSVVAARRCLSSPRLVATSRRRLTSPSPVAFHSLLTAASSPV